MAKIRLTKVEQGQTKIRNVPIAVTPEDFWCCPSPNVFQKSLKTQNPLNKSKSPIPTTQTLAHKKHTSVTEKRPASVVPKSSAVSDEKRGVSSDIPAVNASVPAERMPRSKTENVPKKVSIEFGEPGTSDLRVILLRKQGFTVKLNVHKSILVENSSFFYNKISEQQPVFPCIEIDDCEDVEIYVETIGLMYCKELKQRLIKQSVSRVLRIIKVAEQLGFKSCMLSCLVFGSSAVGWGRRKGESCFFSPVAAESCLDSILILFKQAAEPEFSNKEPVMKQMVLEADNLSWMLEILTDRQAADEFAVMWGSQQELASLHTKLPIVSRHHVSCITVRLFVGIGRGELLPSKDTRNLLLQMWLQPLINDYSWLQHGCRSFDRKVVEEGIGRTILTLPLEEQQSILLSWLGSFLQAGDNCPNLQRAFEVWWRLTFVRPYAESGNSCPLDHVMTPKVTKQ
ncbi:hypothetical protein K7X08_018685 [Anisodus acutangulus]|uniref:At3g05675-like ankyrin-like domain-containing protein n=1 Tax=Anisodus acutangulus TaxID=402998 RepID=A0A9Q1LWJ5_9SOLA|nr:hypothetical protein K7X08_018685 [Anisodus acutangulus]